MRCTSSHRKTGNSTSKGWLSRASPAETVNSEPSIRQTTSYQAPASMGRSAELSTFQVPRMPSALKYLRPVRRVSRSGSSSRVICT